MHAHIFRHECSRTPEKRSTLFRGPLPEIKIQNLEKRLGITLPEDYKDMLRVSNGFDESWDGILVQHELFPAHKVCWIDDKEDYFTDLSADFLSPFENWKLVPEPADFFYGYPEMGKCIQISSEDIEEVWLMPPSNVKEVRDAYLDIMEVNEDVERTIGKAIEEWAGSMEAFMNLEWEVVTWTSVG